MNATSDLVSRPCWIGSLDQPTGASPRCPEEPDASACRLMVTGLDQPMGASPRLPEQPDASARRLMVTRQPKSVGVRGTWDAGRISSTIGVISTGWRRARTTIAISAFCVVMMLWPAAAGGLEFDREAIAAGQWWRAVSGHCVHWNREHLVWDLSVFALLGWLCERQDRARFLLCTLLAATSISLVMWLALPTMHAYRGLSGIDTALFTTLAIPLLMERWSHREWFGLVAVGSLLTALATKIGFETLTGGTLFVDTQAAGFEPVPLAHLVGAVSGLIVGLAPPAKRGQVSFMERGQTPFLDPRYGAKAYLPLRGRGAT